MDQTLSPFAEIELQRLAPSPTNPRKTFADLDDLAASIREQGVMQPILVRLWPDDYPTPEGRDDRPAYEIVAGERRYRAAQLAGLDSIPALVRPLNTRQVLEAQIVENLQRRDVTELEEAEGYQLMMRDHGYTADQLAEKVGKSRSYSSPGCAGRRRSRPNPEGQTRRARGTGCTGARREADETQDPGRYRGEKSQGKDKYQRPRCGRGKGTTRRRSARIPLPEHPRHAGGPSMSKIYSNVMLDLETMGNGPDAAIVAIGAVTFDLAACEIGPAYYNRITLKSAVQLGGVIDASTVAWWMQQSDEARQEIYRPGGVTLSDALRSFTVWVAEHTYDAEMWGNGASFDNVILRSAYVRRVFGTSG